MTISTKINNKIKTRHADENTFLLMKKRLAIEIKIVLLQKSQMSCHDIHGMADLGMVTEKSCNLPE